MAIKTWPSVFVLLLCGIFPMTTAGFTLLGPFEEWQSSELSYNASGEEIGGPRNLGDEFRWNIPVVTYGVDRAFMDFFGEPGIAAVKEAFQMLNELPPASKLDLNQFPLVARGKILLAEEKNLIDLKSAVLGLVLEQLGVGAPEQYVWTLRNRYVWQGPPPETNYLVFSRNFDPLSLAVSSEVNGVPHLYSTIEFIHPQRADAMEIPRVGTSTNSPAASWRFWDLRGNYVSALSRDDAGALKFLLDPKNVNLEPLPENVLPDDPGSTNLVGVALRPGADKLQFVFVDDFWDTTPNWTATYTWKDKYFLNGKLMEQSVKIAQSRPNIVFSAKDVGVDPSSLQAKTHQRTSPNWRTAAGDLPDGPGILEGSVKITLGKLGKSFLNIFPGGITEESVIHSPQPVWASFRGESNIVKYPVRNLSRRKSP